MRDHIRRSLNGTIDYDFYRARAHAERRKARCAAIRTVVQLFRRMVADTFSFQAFAAAHV
jgi:hypothetical protein